MHNPPSKTNRAMIGCLLSLASFLPFQTHAAPPSISGEPDTTAIAQHYYQFSPHASDTDINDNLLFNIVNLPSWAGFNPTTGEMSGIAEQVGQQPKSSENVYAAMYFSSMDTPPTIVPFNATNPATYNQHMAITIYDNQGEPLQLGLYFVKESIFTEVWIAHFTLEGVDVYPTNTSVLFSFDQFGRPSPTPIAPSTFNFNGAFNLDLLTIHWRSVNGAASPAIVGSQFTPIHISQDGVSKQQAANNALVRLSVQDKSANIATLADFAINVVPNQPLDSDNDGIPNVTDTDDDNDGFPDTNDAFPLDPNRAIDTDGDGIDDNADTDDDNDGVADATDPAPLVSPYNRAPNIFGTPKSHVFTGNDYSFTPTASDPDGDPLTFSIKNKPSWATFDSATGKLSGSNVNVDQLMPRWTENIYLTMNLDSRAQSPYIGPFNSKNSTTYNYSTSLPIYDSRGTAHELGIYFTIAPVPFSSWQVNITLDGTDINNSHALTYQPYISFDDNGQPNPVPVPLVSIRGGTGTGISTILTNGAKFPVQTILHWTSAEGSQLPTSLPAPFKVTHVSEDGNRAPLATCPRSAHIEQDHTTDPIDASLTTKNIYLTMNLDATQTVPLNSVFNPNDPSSYNHVTHGTIYDSLGQSHQLGVFFIKHPLPNDTWSTQVTIDGIDVAVAILPANHTLSFDANGRANPFPPSPITLTGGVGNGISNILTNGATFHFITVIQFQTKDQTRTIQQLAAPFQVFDFEQDGHRQPVSNHCQIAITATDSHGNSTTLPTFAIAVAADFDSDNDGFGNQVDKDDDSDGVIDSNDDFPLDPNESQDFDRDGLGNNIDPDDDNDGIIDSADHFPFDPTEFQDHDYDGIGNNADPDDDGDGVLDGADRFPWDSTESIDSDGDGIGNNADPDDDNDGVIDSFDAYPLNSAETTDTDGDGIGNNADLDDDGDGILDIDDPLPLDGNETADTDHDGIGNNTDLDDDNDGLTDLQEIELYQTNPLLADSDFDGLTDLAEVQDHLTSPVQFDTDLDGLSDGYEIEHGFDPLVNNNHASVDSDNDGLTNLEESQLNSNPLKADSDDDGLNDFEEAKVLGTDPMNRDTDGDNLDDQQEVTVTHTNPLKKDSDDDGMPDDWEINHQLQPLVDDSNADPDFDQRSNLIEFNDHSDPHSPEIVDNTENNDFAQAQVIDGAFGLAFSPDIGDINDNTSTVIPHTSIIGFGSTATAVNDVDVYAFTVTQAQSKVILDIDHDASRGPRFDSYIEVFNASGTLLYSNDDSYQPVGQGGSQTEYDSYLEMIINEPGNYYVKVMNYGARAIPVDAVYTLHVSIANHQLAQQP